MEKIIMSGNEAIARGAYEAGCTFAAAYPGTPSTEILENLSTKYLDKVYCHWATNEKVATEMVCGASVGGARAITTMKAQGMNVATDPIFVMTYQGVVGGMVIVCADDPSYHSSQNEQDDRLYAPHAKLLMMEPSDSQECKDFTRDAFAISEKFDIPVMIRTTTRISHSKSIVEPAEPEVYEIKKYERRVGKFSNMPADIRVNREKLEKNLVLAEEFSNNCKYNFVEENEGAKIGIITSGVSYQHSHEVFGDTASYLKIGFSFPIPKQMIKDFAAKYETIYVIEENEPYLELQVKAMGIPCIGKEKLPVCDEFNPGIVRKALLGEETPTYKCDVPNLGRPPQLCAGCPHKGFYFALTKHKHQFVGYGDVGCYVLGYNPPLNGFDAIHVMGASISGGNGLSRVLKQQGDSRKGLAMIGDSTFFHSGLTGVVDMIKTGSDLVVCILDNSATAMTGHQVHPGVPSNLMHDDIAAIDVVAVVKGIGVPESNILVVDPIDQQAMHNAFDTAYAAEGPFVIVSRHPCALIKSVQRANATKWCVVDADKCKGCKACMKIVCPAMSFKDGKASITDTNSCTACGLCMQQCKFGAISKVGE